MQAMVQLQKDSFWETFSERETERMDNNKEQEEEVHENEEWAPLKHFVRGNTQEAISQLADHWFLYKESEDLRIVWIS